MEALRQSLGLRFGPRRVLALAMVTFALLATTGRVAQLAWHDARQATAPPLVSMMAKTAEGGDSEEESRRRQDLAALLQLACPHATEFLDEFPSPTPAVRLTAARQTTVGSSDASGEWLIDPNQWFVPEDRVSPEPESAPLVPQERRPPAPRPSVPPPVVEMTQPQPAPVERKTIAPIPAIPHATISPAPETAMQTPEEAEPPNLDRKRIQPVVEEPASDNVGSTAPRSPIFSPPPAIASPTPVEALHPQDDAGEQSDGKSALESHRELFARNCFPSAAECGECHKKIYDEWKISSHAYAFVSPMFHKFEQKITDLSRGTVGYFCYRCHSPAGVAMCISRDEPIGELPRVAREGVTCIACHRINERYSKTNGERRVVPGDLYAPIYGAQGGRGVAKAIARKDHYKVKTSPDEKGAGQPIHREGRYFEQLTQAEFCTSCHQVAVHPGVKLEVVWEQYRASPACKLGVTCQDCHMGFRPGEPSGYEITSVAEVGGKSVNDAREHHNHVFYGPGYSIAHPGVFPHHEDGDRWTMEEWLQFDWRAGWGTDDFEDALEDKTTSITFPPAWCESDDRCDAREIIEDNLELLGKKRDIRSQVMHHSLSVEGPVFEKAPRVGADLKLHYLVRNNNSGHNVLTASLGAQPQLWANIALIGPCGNRLWETGYTDSLGDVANLHSLDVRAGRTPYDSQLFNLQTMFLITGATGTDREFPLPVNLSFDQVAHLRPGAQPISVLNHPPFIRMESQSIAPLGAKRVKYRIPGGLLQRPGRYRLSFRLRNRAEPIYFMRFCEATPEMERMMNEGILDIHPYSVEFDVR